MLFGKKRDLLSWIWGFHKWEPQAAGLDLENDVPWNDIAAEQWEKGSVINNVKPPTINKEPLASCLIPFKKKSHFNSSLKGIPSILMYAAVFPNFWI